MILSTAIPPVIFGTFAFFLFLVIHILAWRFVSGGRKGVQLLAVLAFISYVLSLLINWLCCPEIIIRHYATLPLFSALVMLYFHLYVGVDRSVSIRVLGELCRAPNGTLDLDQLKNRYSGEDMVRHRIDLMCAKKWLVKHDNRFYCSKKATWLARMSIVIQKFYGIKAGG